MRDDEKSTAGPGRPREFDEADALSAIMNVFWKKGYEGSGLSDLVTATGVRKASLYQAFGNKHQLYLKALANYNATMVGEACKMLRDESRPAEDRIELFLDAPIAALATETGRQGCFLCNAAADRADLDPETAAVVASGYARMNDAIEVALADFRGQIATSIPNAAAMVLSVYAGLRIMARGAVPVPQLERAKDACLRLVFG